ncbi:Uncharacterised protein [Burkholderia pseudomallei]|nr:Uncharacterised protein [Burkholderia pseudomallei]CAJ3244380.1 Uncharacterised protein [Burkholderia pseudomallei]CAJ3290576.1 Uncharacterised protein [Burkholderia pseudomallei]CAJ3756899.1 Uncharacterised protein [Burkholderia pseudomallei]CAJ3806270.1 Uncharacterised protein [Burkholderia pseudomallei]
MFAARPNARRGSEKRASSSPGAHRAPAGPPRDAPSSCSRVAPFRRHLRPPCAQRQRLHHVGLRGRQAHQHDRPADVAIGHVEHVGRRFDQPRALAGPTPLTTSVSPSPRSRASNLPRTLSAGVPYDMPSSTPRHASAIRLTSSNVTAPRGALPPESRSATVPENRASRPFARLFARRAKALRRTPAAATNAIANACAGRRMPPGVAGAPPAQGEDDGEATGSSMRGTTRARRRRCRARASRCPSARLPMRRPRRYGTARTPAIR